MCFAYDVGGRVGVFADRLGPTRNLTSPDLLLPPPESSYLALPPPISPYLALPPLNHLLLGLAPGRGLAVHAHAMRTVLNWIKNHREPEPARTKISIQYNSLELFSKRSDSGQPCILANNKNR